MIAARRALLAVLAAAVPLLTVSCGGHARDSAHPPVTSQPQPSLPAPPTASTTSPPPPVTPTQTEAQTTTSPGEGEPQAPHPLAASLLGHELEQLATERKVVALTFDAGANAAGVPSILATLRRTGVVGTFFLTGRWVQMYPQLARQIGGRYPVANHTYSHQQLPHLATAAVHSEIERAQSLIRIATGQDPRPLFRFPYGSSDRRTIRIVNTLGYTAIRWTVDTLGWEGTTRGQSAASVTSRVLAALKPGEIVLMHVGSPPDGSTLDANALPQIIRRIRQRGYSFVAITDFLPTR